MTLNKEKLKKTVSLSSFFTVAESNILQKFIDIEKNSVVIISPKELQLELKLSHTSIYSALKSLRLKGVLSKIEEKMSCYKLNEEKLEHFYQFVRD
jgi:hypothetical protein